MASNTSMASNRVKASKIDHDTHQPAEIPFTSPTFVRSRNVTLPLSLSEQSCPTYYIVDILMLSNGKLLVAFAHGVIFTIKSTGEIDWTWKLNEETFMVTEVSDGCYVASCGSKFVVFKDGCHLVSERLPARKNVHGLNMRLLDNYQVHSICATLFVRTLKGEPRAWHIHSRSAPRYFRLVKENGTPFIYCCGNVNETDCQLTKFYMTGAVCNVYSNWAFSTAHSLTTTEDGHVFLCFSREERILLISPKMDREVTVLGRSDGLVNPTAIYYSTEDRKLYVANKSKFVTIITFDVRF